MAPEEASVRRYHGASNTGARRTGSCTSLDLSVLKAVSCDVDQNHGTLSEVSRVSGAAILA